MSSMSIAVARQTTASVPFWLKAVFMAGACMVTFSFRIEIALRSPLAFAGWGGERAMGSVGRPVLFVVSSC
jgi:hypothetical protein